MRFKDIVPGMTIHCQSVAERLFLLEQLEKLGYTWKHNEMKPTQTLPNNPKALYIMTEQSKKLSYSCFGANCIDFSDFCIGIDEEVIYQKGLSDAWELVKKLCLSEKDGGLDKDIYIECFGIGASLGSILKNYTCQDVIDIIKDKEKKLKVGDIVDIDGKKAIIVFMDTERIYIIYESGDYFYCQKDKQNIKKTGRKINISKLLSQYLEMENENN